MSDLAFTPTRQMAQSAAMKSQDAYAVARQASGRTEALEAQLTDTRADVADLQQKLAKCLLRISALEAEKADARVTRRKAA